MAVDFFLNLSNDIKGESVDANHKDQIAVMSFSWGASQTTSVAGTGGSGAGKANLADFNIMKTYDKASVPLFKSLLKGTHIDTGVLTASKAGGDGKPFIQLSFTELFVTSVQDERIERGADGERVVQLQLAEDRVLHTERQGHPDGLRRCELRPEEERGFVEKMTPIELYKAGELEQAIKALGEELRSNPLDAKRRTFLFELLCFAGEYDRAEKQLDVLANQNPKAAMGVLMYRSAIHAERTRQEMFSKGDFPAHTEDNAATDGGTWNGEAFEMLADADERIGDHLECFIAGGYTWIPTKYIEQLAIEPPTTLRDLLWARARIQASPKFRLQDLGEILIPVLSPLSYRSSDDAVRLGRASVWEDQPDGSERLLGQKLLLVDGEEIPILEFRSIEWMTGAAEAPDGESGDANP